MNILIIIAAIGGAIKIIETSVKVIKFIVMVVENWIAVRRRVKRLREMKQKGWQ